MDVERDMSQPVSLQPMTAILIERVRSLDVEPGQSSFVASNDESIEDWHDNPDLLPMAIFAADTVVGFAMMEHSEDSDGTHEINIFRLMIDHRHQGRGYGRKALEALLARYRSDSRRVRITTCFVPENAVARRMYASLGFVETGVDDDGEILAELSCHSAAQKNPMPP